MWSLFKKKNNFLCLWHQFFSLCAECTWTCMKIPAWMLKQICYMCCAFIHIPSLSLRRTGSSFFPILQFFRNHYWAFWQKLCALTLPCSAHLGCCSFELIMHRADTAWLGGWVLEHEPCAPGWYRLSWWGTGGLDRGVISFLIRAEGWHQSDQVPKWGQTWCFQVCSELESNKTSS